MSRRARRDLLLCAVTVVLLLVLLSLPGAQGHGEELFEDAEVVFVPYDQNPSVTIDGPGTADEYGEGGRWVDEDSGVTGLFLHDDANLYAALRNPEPGWLALGYSSDLAAGMGFIVIGLLNNTFTAVERIVDDVEEIVFSEPPDGGAIVQSAVVQTDGQVNAELKLALKSSLWDMEPGMLVPTIVAFNKTALEMPMETAGSETHPLRSYVFREQDDSEEIRDLFEANISPVPGLVAVATIVAGVAAIFYGFIRRKG